MTPARLSLGVALSCLFALHSTAGVCVVAHRGAMREAPENSIAAFERARQLGADAVELDVRETADGALVVLHDATVDRTTQGHGPISQLTAVEARGLGMLFYEDALRWGRRHRFCIDTDSKTESAAKIAAAIRAAEMESLSVIEGPPARLDQFAVLLPQAWFMRKVATPAESRGKLIRLTLAQLGDAAFVNAARANGTEIAITLLGANDRAERMEWAIRAGATYIETDFPAELDQVRKRLKTQPCFCR